MMLAALDILGVVSERLFTIEAGLGRQRHNTNTQHKEGQLNFCVELYRLYTNRLVQQIQALANTFESETREVCLFKL